MNQHTLAIGCAAGFSGDRTDAALPIVETLIARGGAGALIFEMLAERTLALAQLDRRKNPDNGYARLLDPMVRPVLRRCVENNIPIVGNFGAANPRGAAALIRRIAREQGISNIRIAVIAGDDLSDSEWLRAYLKPQDAAREIVSANVYLGAEAIAAALRAGAQVVVTGRVADPSLVVGPVLAHFNWRETDWERLGRATMAGHLLECGAQVTGGYFADPGFKDVPDLHNVGFPIAEIEADGSFVISKAEATGGIVNAQTVKEQLLYEVHDPAAYLTPDVIADITDAEVHEVGANRVAVTGVRGHKRPATLKAIVCYAGGWLGEGEISYAGPNAEARARLAAEIIRRRLGDALQMRFDLIGVLSVFGDDYGRALSERLPSIAGAFKKKHFSSTKTHEGNTKENEDDFASLRAASCDFVEESFPENYRDVRLRVAGVHADRAPVERLMNEITALYTNGPAGGGGVRTAITARLNSASCFVPRELVPVSFTFLE